MRWPNIGSKVEGEHEEVVGRLNWHGLETKMKSTQTNLSRLKACRKLAGGKAAARRPRSASRFDAALKGREKRAGSQPVAASHSQSQQNFYKIAGAAVSGAPSGRKNFCDAYLGYRCAQPQANFRQPFRLLHTVYAAPTELNNRLTGWATKISLLRSYDTGKQNNPFEKN